ncbi:MAG: sodium:proton antiporter, partial [Comamonadaceae bacterium]
VIATPDTLGVRRMASIARQLNPGIEIVVRSHNEAEARLLEADETGKVFLGERELATAMTRYVVGRCAA